MKTSTLGFEVRDGADVPHDRYGDRYVEFLVDSVPLLEVVGTSTELVPFLWLDLGLGHVLGELERLQPPAGQGVGDAVAVLVCCMCGDLECGAVEARVVADDEVVRWRLAEVHFDFSRPDPRVEVPVLGTAEVCFERIAYEAVLTQVRREITDAAGRARARGAGPAQHRGRRDGREPPVPTYWGEPLGPAEDPSVLRRHLRRHGRRDRACPFCADVGDTVVAIMRMEAHDAPRHPIEVGELGWVTDLDCSGGCLPFSHRLGSDEVFVTFGSDGGRWTQCGPLHLLKVTRPRRGDGVGGG